MGVWAKCEARSARSEERRAKSEERRAKSEEGCEMGAAKNGAGSARRGIAPRTHSLPHLTIRVPPSAAGGGPPFRGIVWNMVKQGACQRAEGWTDGRMDGWRYGRMEVWTDGGRMEGWTDGRFAIRLYLHTSIPPYLHTPT